MTLGPPRSVQGGMQGPRRILGSVPDTVAHKAPSSVLITATTG
jgi:nucleotide-binding universal stress UspA family protein